MLLPRPDLFVSGDGQAAAIRGADGRLSVLHSPRDTFAFKEWLMADGDARTPKDASLSSGVRCEASAASAGSRMAGWCRLRRL
jgi:competence protein ComEC